MSKLDLLRLFDTFDGEANVSDFTVDELNELLERTDTQTEKEKYFSYYNDVKSPSLKKQDW